jgi:hypothetical protein
MAIGSFELNKLFIFHIPSRIIIRHGSNWVDDVFGGNNKKEKVTDDGQKLARFSKTSPTMLIALVSSSFGRENENPFWPLGDTEEDGTLA